MYRLLLALITIHSYCYAEEIVVKSGTLPGASMEQEIIYSTTEKDYNNYRDEILARLRDGDQSAMVNPIDGPTKIVQTTAKIGFEIKGVGTSEGRKHLRRITAAEEALFLYQNDN